MNPIIIFIPLIVVAFASMYAGYQLGYQKRESEFQNGSVTFSSWKYPVMNVGKLKAGYVVTIYNKKFVTFND